ncbi:MAG TPA: RodZ domain-containing protein [Bryobacteraceae bacterium]|nr:RodZ domain-containing protein [Bryobacteraceae bacterium]
MESVGQKLREARSRLGLTLEQVSADTRISLKNLRAIEADDLSCISSPFFYRSFVRQFAGKVEIDYTNIADEVQQTANTLPQPLMPGQGDTGTIHVSALKVRRPRNLRWLRSVMSFCVVVTACSAMYALWQNSHADWHSLVANLTAHINSQRKNNVAVVKATEPLAPLETKQSAVAPPPTSDFYVQLSAIERTWLSIVADGKETFSGVLDASETKILEGHESARIRTGNAGGLNVTFNGKDIGTLGPRGTVRTVVFTKNNYEVLPSAPSVALTAFIQSAE